MWLFLLLVIPLLGLLILLISPRHWQPFIPVVVTALNILDFIGYWVWHASANTDLFSHWLQMDQLSTLITGITLFVGFTAAIYSIHYLQMERKQAHPTSLHAEKVYYALFLVFYIALIGVPLMQNVLLTWALIEGTALASAMLIDFHHTKTSTEAAWKYIVLMEIGGLLGLFGTLTFLIGQPITLHATTWQLLTQYASHIPAAWLKTGFILVLVGYGTKAGLVPFNAWLPDAHSQAPSPTSAMLSAIKLNVAMYGILRCVDILNAGGLGVFGKDSLAAIGLLTVVVSTLMTVRQHDFKRLFAYSSSENMGLIAIGFALGPIGVLGGMLQMINHSVIKSLLFYQSGDMLFAGGSTTIDRLRGYAHALPYAGGILTLGFLAIAGAPPFGLFISEFMIIYALFHQMPIWFAIVIVLMLAILFANFLRYALQIGFGRPSAAVQKFKLTKATREWGAVIPFTLHMVAILALGILLPFGMSMLGQ